MAARTLTINSLNLPKEVENEAKVFATQLGYGTSSKMFYFAVKWFSENVKPNGELLNDRDAEQFYSDVEEGNYDGPVHRRINEEIFDLIEAAANNPPVQSAPSVRTTRITRAPKPAAPTVSIWINGDQNASVVRIEKGQPYTVSWKSENAVTVVNSQQFDRPIDATELSGSRSFTSNRVTNKTFAITVANASNRRAKAVVKLQVVRAATVPQATVQATPRTTRTSTTTPSISTRTTRITRTSGVQTTDTRILTEISGSVSRILKLLEKQTTFIVKGDKQRRIREQRERRRRKEDRLEKVKGAGSKVLEAIYTPIKNIFDKIWKFMILTLLGRAFTEFLNWVNDPKNAGKVKTIGRFFKDFWWLIGGLGVWFLTPFGGFVKNTVKLVGSFTKTLLGLLPKLARFALANPLLAGTVLGGAGAIFLTELGKKEQERQLNQAAQEKAKREGKSVEDARSELNKTIKPFGEADRSFTNPSAWAAGGEIFSGLVTNKIGKKVSGAGADTQLLPVEGGGNVVLQKGEVVLQKGARERMIKSVGIDPLAFNIGSNANKPRNINSSLLKAMSGGGVVGSNNPKISTADYNALLAITSAEDLKNPQGRADVAQALYNRLYASKKYGMNFMPYQGRNTIKDIINGPGQFEPTKKNPHEWLNITDRLSAARALANHKPDLKITTEQALKILDETEKILKNPVYQKKAKEHVQGRTFFYGTSQHGNMKQGDVLRGKNYNFFSHDFSEGTPYHKERGNIAAPIPSSFMPKPKAKPKAKPQAPQNPLLALLGVPRAASAKPTKRKPQKRSWWDPRGLMGMKTGGLFVDSQMPKVSGDSRDKHPALLEAGEFVIPKRTVQMVGLDFFNDLVANTDRNSAPAKMSPIPRMQEQLTPLPVSANPSQIMTLPAIRSGAAKSVDTASNDVPYIPAASPNGTEARAFLSSIYGIV